MAYQARGRDPLLDSNMAEAIEKRGKELLGLVLMCLGAMAVAMIVSYSPDDPSWMSATDAPIENLAGADRGHDCGTSFHDRGLGRLGSGHCAGRLGRAVCAASRAGTRHRAADLSRRSGLRFWRFTPRP